MKEFILSRMRKIVAIAMLAIGILALAVALATLEIGTFAKPQGGLAPMVFSVILIIASAINLVIEFLSPDSIPGDLRDVDWRKFALYMAICVFYVFLVDKIGFAADTFISLFLMFKVTGLKGKLRPLLYSLVFSLAIYLLFTFAMDVRLPSAAWM